MQMTTILKICLGIMLASGRSLAGPAYSTAPPEIWDECPKPPGQFPLFLPNPVDCGSYYQCSWSTAYLLQCPPSLHFNPALQVCDYPSAANCVITTMYPTPPPSTTTYGPIINTTTTHAPVINTTTTHAPVNTTSTFAPVYTTTHAPVNTTTTTHAPVINTTTTHAPVINTTTTFPPVNTSTTHAPVINTTTTHAPVINTTTTHAPVFNVTSDPPFHNRTTTTSTTTSPAPVFNVTSDPPFHNSTTTTSTTTSHTQVFNVTSDPPFHTSSTTTTSTTTKPDIVTAPPEIAAQCPPYTLNHVAHIPNPDDCTTFYACLANGWAILQQCPPGQHFNPELKVCDDPSTAGCHPAK